MSLQNQSHMSSQNQSNMSSQNQSNPTPVETPSQVETEDGSHQETRKIRYCHYFSNFGKCNFEKNTGRSCGYAHNASVPMCNSGTSCTRQKCMFKHPKVPRGSNFLASNYPYPININPWQMMTPWWSTPQHPGQQETLQPFNLRIQSN